MIDPRIKFRHIQSFYEIAREKSLKAAAEKLHLTQPAISKTLKELEEILGAKLMERSRAGVTLTKQGQIFLHFAQMSLASLQQGLDGVEREGRAERERLTIGSLPSVAAWLMPKVAAEFANLAPNAMLRIVDGPHAYLIDRLRLGELDMVLGRLGASDTMQGISFTQLYSEQVCFVVRREHPILENPVLAEVQNWQVIYPPEGSAIRPLVERFMIANGVSFGENYLETVSGAFGRNYTRQSDAIWIISRGVVAREIEEGRLVELPFKMELTTGPVGLMRRPEVVLTPVQQAFQIAIDTVLEESGVHTV